MNIAFIGTGIMGSRMASNLLDNGHTLTVHNRTPSKADALISKGAQWADTPAMTITDTTDCVITMLAHPRAIIASALNPETGFLNAMPQDMLWIDCSTTNPDFARQMADETTARHLRYMDAPVAGSKNQAQDAQLVFFIGGNPQDVTDSSDLFHAMGKAINHVGEHGMGTALKLVINHMLATSMLAFAEGIVLGESLGLSTEKLLDTLIGGVVAPPYLASKRTKIEAQDFEAEFPLQWMQKDMQMVAETAFSTGVAMPTANITKEIYQFASRAGYAQADFSAIIGFLRSNQA